MMDVKKKVNRYIVVIRKFFFYSLFWVGMSGLRVFLDGFGLFCMLVIISLENLSFYVILG